MLRNLKLKGLGAENVICRVTVSSDSLISYALVPWRRFSGLTFLSMSLEDKTRPGSRAIRKGQIWFISAPPFL